MLRKYPKRVEVGGRNIPRPDTAFDPGSRIVPFLAVMPAIECVHPVSPIVTAFRKIQGYGKDDRLAKYSASRNETQ